MITSFESPKSPSSSISHSELNDSTLSKEHLSQLRSRILSLETRNRSLCEKYKNNFKQAFEAKINSYRLEALLSRRNQKERGESQRAAKQKLLQRQKRKRVKQLKLDRMSSRLYVAETLEQRAQKARSRFMQEHELYQKRRLENEHQEIIRRQNMRNVMYSNRFDIRRERQQKRYMNEIRQRERDSVEMREELAQIISKEGCIDKLQDVLHTGEFRASASMEERD